MSEHDSLIEQVQNNYYENNAMASLVGGNTQSTAYQLFYAIENISNNITKGMEVVSNWLSSDLTWYTKTLRTINPHPFFDTDSEKSYLERILFIQNEKFNQTYSVIDKVSKVIAHFINEIDIDENYRLPDDSVRYSFGVNDNRWSIPEDTESIEWDANNSSVISDTSAKWGDDTDLQAYDAVVINADGATDKWLEYWEDPKNYTKLLPLIDIFIGSHVFHELRIDKSEN